MRVLLIVGPIIAAVAFIMRVMWEFAKSIGRFERWRIERQLRKEKAREEKAKKSLPKARGDGRDEDGEPPLAI